MHTTNVPKIVLNNPALFRAYMEKIQTIDLKLCKYDKTRKVLTLSSEHTNGFPKEFYVKSQYTGKSVRFVPVLPGDSLFDEDGWDGEQMIYRPCSKVNKVDYMVVYNV